MSFSKDVRSDFLDATILMNLSGFSGARVMLMQSNGGRARFVRKMAKDEVEIRRLIDQKERMLSLSRIFDGDVRLPGVLDEGHGDGGYWYDMEYVAGMDGVEYLSRATAGRAHTYQNVVMEILRVLAESHESDSEIISFRDVLANKVSDIKKKSTRDYSCILDEIEFYAKEIPCVSRSTLCHGDMTLENMIFCHDGRVFLIDPIPSPAEHFWFDISKVFQDLESRWFVHRKRKLPLGITVGICDRLVRDIRLIFPDYIDAHPVMLALCFARILPYCVSDSDVNFVTERIVFALNSRLGK